MLEDRLLIWKFNRGNRYVLRLIYEKYKDDLMTLATALLYDNNSAEDVVHDVFVAFINSCGKLQLTGSLKGYLTTCVVNNVRNRNKAGQRQRTVALEETAAIASTSSRADQTLMCGEELNKLAWALSRIPYEQREVLLLRTFSGMKFKKIAESQGESINTIQGRLRYGLKKLRSLLDSEVEK